MLNLALTSIDAALSNIDLSGSPLIEKYGGLTFPVTVKKDIGTTEGGESVTVDKTYPVAAGVNFQSCIAGRRYQELVPNSKYRSIAYWEQMGSATVNGRYAGRLGRNVAVYDIACRLVTWLNIPKMNLNSTEAAADTIAAPVALKICDVLEDGGKWHSVPGTAYEGAKVRFVFQGQEPKDPAVIFGRYDYGDKVQAFMFYPFDFFALRFTAQLMISKKCLSALTIGTPESCAVNL